ncbi:hypothetical protein VitviT2T_002469 [Vitis vinifera]|uniref:Uncharacterized protein n=1 Tax=Vitis vinifera TaxID=29760 RepID=A0ABY9BK19_VITVI|nr:hypothetical protein VitviT2T_002469 [Vitis vinifera]
MLCIENSVNRVRSNLILSGITDQTLCISESDVRGSSLVALIVGDDLDTVVLPYFGARVGSSKINLDGWEKGIRSIFFQGVEFLSLYLQEGIRTGCPDAPSDGFVSHGQREEYKSVGLLPDIRRLPRDPFLLRAKAYIYSFRGTVPLINGEEIFYVCHDDIRRQHGHRHLTGGCQKPW